MTSDQSTIQFFHRPGGPAHPYRKGSYERHPAVPVEGQPTTLGVKIISAEQAQRVTVALWTEKSTEKEIVLAECIECNQNESHWKAVLPGLAAGLTYMYQFVVDTEVGQDCSDMYGFEVLSRVRPIKIYAVHKTEDSLCYSFGSNRPDETVNLVYSLMDDGGIRGQWSLNTGRNGSLEGSDAAHNQTLSLGDFSFSMTGEPVGVVVSHQASGNILEEKQPVEFLVDSQGGIHAVRQSFSCSEDEAFFGFGERFNALDQRGNRLDNVVYEQFTNQGKYAYFPVPFFVSSRGFAVYFETTRNMQFDLAETDQQLWSYEAEVGGEAAFSFRLWANPQPEHLIATTTGFLGKPKLPPNWVFGLWMSANCWDNQQKVVEEVAKADQTEIPATVLVLEAWSDEITFYLWNDAQFEQKPSSEAYHHSEITYPADGRWPDPKGLCDYLHDKGIRLVLWLVPVMKGLHAVDAAHCHQSQHAADQAYMAEKQYCLLTEDNHPYLIPTGNWFSLSMVPDFNNPAAVKWWFDKRRYLLDGIGIDGFKTDGGEHIIRTDIHSVSGETGDQLRNTFTHLYQRMYSEFTESSRGEDMVLFSRSGYTGTQQYACHWAGDQASDWDSYKAAIYAGLSAALCGVSFWSFDIGGFAGPMPSAELYLRSAAMATFCPIMQYHSMPKDPEEITNARTPWNVEQIDPAYKVVDIFRNFVNVRMNLLPYILDQAVKSPEQGLPLMRSVAVFCPKELPARKFPFQYFFGPDLLVAPVVEPGVENWRVYLPEGEWYDFWTDRKEVGGQVIAVETPMDSIPVFVRAGAILPLNFGEGLELGSPVGNSVDNYHNLTFKIYPGESGELMFSPPDSNDPISVKYHLGEDALVAMVNAVGRSVNVLIPNVDALKVVLDGEEIVVCGSLEEFLSADGPAWVKAADRVILKTGLGEGTRIFKIFS